MSYAVHARKHEAAPVVTAATPAGRAAGSLRIGRPNDAFEQEADCVADAVVTGDTARRHWSLSRMSIEPLLQRKCDCGGAGECEECEGEKTLQRKAHGPVQSGEAPPIVHDVLSSPGRPLDDASRRFFEGRFGRDFSKVRIHTDDKAATSAQTVQAQAYSVGSQIVFGKGRYRPGDEGGQRLIAHELAHTLQQRPTLARRILEDEPAANPSAPKDPLDIFGPLGPAKPMPIPARGTNPADCVQPLCPNLSKIRTPTKDDETRAIGHEWLWEALNCVSGGAAASKASHSKDIADHEKAELTDEVQRLDDELKKQSTKAGRFQEYLSSLREMCEHRLRQIQMEFYYNLIFENPAGAKLKWGYSPPWDEVEGALSALPIEATWGNPHLLRFRREACHPDDVDPKTGLCSGQGGGHVGGETSASPGGVDRITVYDAGLGQQPYGRSKTLGLPATSQTIRHEVGHVIDELTDKKDRDEFFKNIMHWRQYSWSWVVATGSGVPQTWKDERRDLMTQTGMDDAQLDAWLKGLKTSTPVDVKGITYSKEPVGSSDFFLTAYQSDQMPAGAEFEYARTNQGDYFAEIYTLAVSKPEFLSSKLPSAQSEWLRRVVFQTPVNMDALARQAALAEPALSEFLSRGSKLYTHEQLDALLAELAGRQRQRGAGSPSQRG